MRGECSGGRQFCFQFSRSGSDYPEIEDIMI
jgi:hypothetical protein